MCRPGHGAATFLLLLSVLGCGEDPPGEETSGLAPVERPETDGDGLELLAPPGSLEANLRTIPPEMRHGSKGRLEWLGILGDRRFVHGNGLRDAVYDEDGATILSIGGDGLRLWDASSGVELRWMRDAERPMEIGWSCAMVPGAAQAVSLSRDGVIRLWDLNRGQVLERVEPFWEASPQPGRRTFSIDGGRIATGARWVAAHRSGRLRVWDRGEGRLVVDASLPGEPADLRFSREGAALVAGSDRFLVGWDLSTGKRVLDHRPHRESEWGADIDALAISPDRESIFTAGWDTPVALRRAGDGAILREMATGESEKEPSFLIARFTPDGRRLVAIASDGMYVWNPEDGSIERRFAFDTEFHPLTLEFRPGGSGFLFNEGATLYQGNLVEGVTSPRRRSRVWRADLAGKRLGVRDEAGTLRVHDRQGVTSTIEGCPEDWRFGPEGDTILVLAGRTLRILSAETGDPVHEIEGVVDFALAEDGDRLLLGSSDRGFEIRDSRTFEILSATSDRVHFRATLDREGERHARVDRDGRILVFETADWKERLDLEGHSTGVSGLSFTADGRRLVSFGYDRRLLVHDVESGAVVLDREVDGVYEHLVRDPRTGRHAAVSEHDLVIWDFESGSIVDRIRVEEGASGLSWAGPAVLLTLDGRVNTYVLDRGGR